MYVNTGSLILDRVGKNGQTSPSAIDETQVRF